MSERRPAARLAVDIGGTFTDIVLLDGRAALRRQGADHAAGAGGGRDRRARAACWPRRASPSPTSACSCTAPRLPPTPSSSARARETALIATDGFRDVIEIADEGRFDQYDINIVKTAAAGAARAALHGAGAHGRARGRAAARSTRARCARSAKRLRELDIEAVAVALIHAYANPAHELRIGEILAEMCPASA